MECLQSSVSPMSALSASPKDRTATLAASAFLCRAGRRSRRPRRSRRAAIAPRLWSASRDEAHRFAIGTHRAKRTKALGQSPLDEIAGVGARRKRALLHHFGSARAVARAGLGELERVVGISQTVAKKVYDHFHADR